MGYADGRGTVAKQGEIPTDWDFCNRRYRFDTVDMERLFAQGILLRTPQRQQ
ncbi:MAG: hypothetical protein G8D59_07235 [gamma proteobacterium symbiont of Phacoides pectinatus]